MKTIIYAFLILFSFTLSAQVVEGKLTVGGKSNMIIDMESNSTFLLIEKLKAQNNKFEIDFNGGFENVRGEKIALFNYRTIIKKDSKPIKNTSRKVSLPYKAGKTEIPIETFDFLGTLVQQPPEEEEPVMGYEWKNLCLLSEGDYVIVLYAEPAGIKGVINPVKLSFSIH